MRNVETVSITSVKVMEKRKSSKSVTKDLFLPAILLLCMLLSVMLTACDVTSKYQIERKKELILEHLEKKYGEKFEIISSRYTGSNEVFEFSVTPVQNKCFFTASIHDEDSISQKIYEEYWFFRLQSEFIKRYESTLVKFFRNTTYFGGGVVSIVKKDIRDRYETIPNDPKWRDLEYLETNEIQNIEFYQIDLFTFASRNQEGMDTVYEDIYSMVRYFKKKKIGQLAFGIRVYDQDALLDSQVKMRLEALKNSKNDGYSIDEFENYLRDRKLLLGVYPNGNYYKLNEINSFSDFMNLVEFNNLEEYK